MYHLIENEKWNFNPKVVVLDFSMAGGKTVIITWAEQLRLGLLCAWSSGSKRWPYSHGILREGSSNELMGQFLDSIEEEA